MIILFEALLFKTLDRIVRFCSDGGPSHFQDNSEYYVESRRKLNNKIFYFANENKDPTQQRPEGHRTAPYLFSTDQNFKSCHCG